MDGFGRHIRISMRNRKGECGSLAGVRFYPDAPTLTFHNLLTNRQTNARAGILGTGV
jgi:hypothetical protein